MEYTHDDPNRPGAGQRHRLITDLTNPEYMPAREAPFVYHARQDPDRLSFLDSLRVSQCQLPESPQIPAEVWYPRLLREVRRQELRPRRDRWYARVIERNMSNWRKKRPEHRSPPQPTKPFRDAVVLVI